MIMLSAWAIIGAVAISAAYTIGWFQGAIASNRRFVRIMERIDE